MRKQYQSTIVEIKERGLTAGQQAMLEHLSTIVEIKERGVTSKKVLRVGHIYNSRN